MALIMKYVYHIIYLKLVQSVYSVAMYMHKDSITCNLFVYRLIKEMYLIVPHVERLQDTRKSLQQTIHDACTVKIISYIRGCQLHHSL